MLSSSSSCPCYQLEYKERIRLEDGEEFEDANYNINFISSMARRTAWTCQPHRLKNPGPVKWTSPSTSSFSSSSTTPSSTSILTSKTLSSISSPSSAPTTSATSPLYFQFLRTTTPPVHSWTSWSAWSSSKERTKSSKKVTRPSFSQLRATIESDDSHHSYSTSSLPLPSTKSRPTSSSTLDTGFESSSESSFDWCVDMCLPSLMYRVKCDFYVDMKALVFCNSYIFPMLNQTWIAYLWFDVENRSSNSLFSKTNSKLHFVHSFQTCFKQENYIFI